MTKEESIAFGKKLRAAREAKGLDIAGALRLITHTDPTIKISRITLLRIEHGGRLPSEPQLVDGQHIVLNRQSLELRDKLMNIFEGKSAETAPAASAQPVELTATEKRRNNMKKAHSVLQQRRMEYRKIADGSTLLTTHGFSLSAVKGVLSHLRSMRLPTDAVKAAIKKQFADTIDALDKD